MEQIAIMNVEKGEEVVAGLVSGHIPGTGRYKFLAKKNRKGAYEWAHFVERDNGFKEKLYKGEVKDAEALELLVEIMNKTLKRIYGDKAQMKGGFPEIRSVFGKSAGHTAN